jgi:tetratricopeptide (TPR) repeat protein
LLSRIRFKNYIKTEIKMAVKSALLKIILINVLMSLAVSSAADVDFVGSVRCESCHQGAMVDWKQSDHYLAMAHASPASVLGDFSGVSVNFHNIESRLYQRDSEYLIETLGADQKRHEFVISYTFGHYPLQQYLVAMDGGHLQALNIAWDSRDEGEGGQRWIHLQPNEPITTESPFFWTRHLQNWNTRCAECHSTNLEKNYDVEKNTFDTKWSEINVACEACHGPGSDHVSRAESKTLGEESGLINAGSSLKWKFGEGESIAHPEGEKTDEYLNMCGGCHSRRAIIDDLDSTATYHDQYQIALLDEGLYYPDGQIQDEVYVLGSFLQSKMHAKGVTCMNCHQPHTGKLILQGNNLCAQCHLSTEYDTTSHHFHPSGSEGTQCVECHMPETNYMLVDERRDHKFGVPNPAVSEKLGTPNACNGCHKGTTGAWAVGALAGWLKEPLNTDAYSELVAAARLGDPVTTRGVIAAVADESSSAILKATLLEQLSVFPSRVSAEAAANYLMDENPLVRSGAIRSLRGAPSQLRWQLLSPLIEDPVKSVRMEVAISLSTMPSDIPLEDIGSFVSLMNEYRGSLSKSIDMPSTQTSLGILELNLGDPLKAEQAYEGALRIEPNYIPAMLNLADLYRATNREAMAVPLLQSALEVAPDSGAAQFSYGLSLVRQREYETAIPYLRAATERQDSQPRYAYVYAIALDSVSRTDEALVFLNQANKDWPNQYDLLVTEVRYMEKQGRTDGILVLISKLSQIAPGSPEVKRLIGQYVQKK